jgi:Putative beta barrel porin-7 (BBP7)
MKFRMLLSAVVLLAAVRAASAQDRPSRGSTPVVLQQFQPFRPPRARTAEHVVAHQEPEEIPAPEETSPDVEGGPLSDAEGDVMPYESPCGGDLCGGSVDWCGASQGPWFGGIWARNDYLLWWGRGVALSPLATTSSQSSLGVLSAADTRVVLGDDRVDTTHRSGGRTDFGIWIDPQQNVGVGGNFLGVENVGSTFVLQSNGDPLLARPFFNVSTGLDDSQVVASTGVSAGWINVETTNSFLGAEAYVRESLVRGPRRRIDILYGYRFARLDESITIRDWTVSTNPGGGIPLGTVIAGRDLFDTQNTFHGGELGVRFSDDLGRFTWNALAKVALGNVRQSATVDGDTIVTVPGFDPVTSVGSLYALSTNIGSYQRDRFAVIPEVNFNVGYRLTRAWTARAGYTFLLWNRVAQAARQIDQSINPTQITGPLVGSAQPAFSFHNSEYWLQGVNFGLECRF